MPGRYRRISTLAREGGLRAFHAVAGRRQVDAAPADALPRADTQIAANGPAAWAGNSAKPKNAKAYSSGVAGEAPGRAAPGFRLNAEYITAAMFVMGVLASAVLVLAGR